MTDESTRPVGLKYNHEHTWLKPEANGRGRAGVTYYAQKQLKDVVFVEMPEIGREVVHLEPFGVIESAKATNDLYSPVSGRIVEVNQAVIDDPGLVNRDPYGKGWMVVIELSDPTEIERLISAEAYGALTGG